MTHIVSNAYDDSSNKPVSVQLQASLLFRQISIPQDKSSSFSKCIGGNQGKVGNLYNFEMTSFSQLSSHLISTRQGRYLDNDLISVTTFHSISR